MKYKLSKDNIVKGIASILLTTSILSNMSGCTHDISNQRDETSTLVIYNLENSLNEANDDPLKVMKDAGFRIEKKIINKDYNIYKLLNNNLNYFLSLKGPNEDGSNIFVNYFPNSFENVCCSKEFAKSNKEENITWDDIRKTLNNNDNLDDRIKNIINSGIDNLELKKFNIDLGTLNYNLKRLKLEYIAKNDDYQYINIMAKFEADKNTIYINPNSISNALFERMVCHEILGHATNIAYRQENGGTYCTTNIGIAIVEDNKLLGNVTLGKAFEEGLAEYISYLATNTKIKYDDTNYATPLYLLVVMCKLANITIEEYNDNGVEYLIDKLIERNLSNLVSIIRSIDVNFLYKLDGYQGTLDHNEALIYMLIEYSNLCKEQGKDKQQIIEILNDIIDSYKDIIIPFKEEGYDFLFDYTTEENMTAISFDYIKNNLKSYLDYIFENNKIKK